MIRVRKSADRGHVDHGWLDTYHTFSFATFHDPEHVHYGPLRVINQDRVAPRTGFGMHGHENMEIVTYLLAGELEHRDSMGNGSRMTAGEVQLMSAGRGVRHSETNPGDETLELLQMWVHPRENGGDPRYEQRAFDETERRGTLRLVVSPDGAEGSLTIGQDARLYAALLAEGERAELPLAEDRAAWVHVARGSVGLGTGNGDATLLEPGDGAAVEGVAFLELEGRDDAELVVWELPRP